MSKKKLLLADDSVTIQKVVNLTFADEGIEVISVGDGDSAMTKILETSPDLVMLDVNMPGLSGYEICERLRQSEQFKRLPVILLVGSFEPFDEDESRRVGANDYLTKPFQSIRQLVNTVTNLLVSNQSEVDIKSETILETPFSESTTAEFPNINIPAIVVNNKVEDISAHLEMNKPKDIDVKTYQDVVNLETVHLDSDYQENYQLSKNNNEDILETGEFKVEETLSSPSFETFEIDESREKVVAEEKSFEFVFNKTEEAVSEVENDESNNLKKDPEESVELMPDFNENIVEVEESQVEIENEPQENIELNEDISSPDNFPFPEAASILELDENNLLEIAPREEDFLVNIEEDNDFDSEIKFSDSTFSNNDLFEINMYKESPVVEVFSNKTIQSNEIDEKTIDEIVRRVIEKLSDNVIREVAWEVVPAKTDLLLKQIIEEKLENS